MCLPRTVLSEVGETWVSGANEYRPKWDNTLGHFDVQALRKYSGARLIVGIEIGIAAGRDGTY